MAGPPPPSEPDLDLVTVVIPARNEERSIGRCLESVLRQSERNLQVVVVDSGSEDATADIVRAVARRDARVEVVSIPMSTIPRSLNQGLAMARGRWFVRIDAHAEVPRDYVGQAVGHLRTGKWGGVGGRKEGVGVTAAGRAIAASMRSRFGVGNSLYHYGVAQQSVDHVPFGAYPIDLLRRMGGWDERLLANEDFELDYRLVKDGHDLLFDPEMVIAWECRQSIAELFRQYRRYGKAKVAVARLHPGSLRARHFAPPLLVAWLGVDAIVGLRRTKAAVLALIPYIASLAAASTLTARRVSGARAKASVPLAFLAMHLGWGIGFWEGALASVG